jgi:hypothetical protein
MTREDHERTLRDANAGQAPSQSQTQEARILAASLMPHPTTVREALHLVRGDYTHGHPGLPPKDYQQPPGWRKN